MSSLPGLDMGVGGIPSAAVSVFGSIAMNGDEYVRCLVCGYGGCDVRVSGCGCTLHARCLPLKADEGQLNNCPQCSKQTSGLFLFPMSFREIDEARKTATSLPPGGRGRGRKRKSEAGACAFDDKGNYVSERRTGRWTTEEMVYCDKLIEKFETGELPIVSGIKLNEFLGNMLKSKQSRLTKKMKNAKLSTKTFQRTVGFLADANEAREFSELEDAFFQGIQDPQERAEIKFHMQREWREQFSQYCVSICQPLDADSWLSSVEEMDRRASQAQNAARMSRRKLMVGMALRTDSLNPDHGVFIEKTEAEQMVAERSMVDGGDDETEASMMLGLLSEQSDNLAHEMNGKSRLLHSAPFLAKTISYIERHSVPFEHVDLWVPSFVPANSETATSESCRLCYAGSGTVDKEVGEDGKTNRPLTAEELFNLHAFGDYSQKFSFDVGCGLPGRVYDSGRPTWEQSVQNAPHHHFERCGGAMQWGVKTVLGIPISSPNVGRIVVTLYSHHDRPRDQDLVVRLMEEFGRLMPYPKWKLVVDIGEPDAPLAAARPSSASVSQNSFDVVDSVVSAAATNNAAPAARGTTAGGKDPRIDEVVSLLGEFMPSDPTSTMSPYLSGFMSLRLLLLRLSRSVEEDELANTMMDSYSSYSAGGRSRNDIAIMLARDYMFLSQQQQQQQQQQQVHQQQQQVQQQQQPQPFLRLGNNMVTGSSMMFGGNSSTPCVQNGSNGQQAPQVPGAVDAMSIVSN